MTEDILKILFEKAIKVREKSYSPYSKFKVGAALLSKNGAIFDGCNVENASFGLTCCAERTALFKAVSEGETSFEKIVICTDSNSGTPPCGACLQVMMEFNPEMEVYSISIEGKVLAMHKLNELLPFAFQKGDF